MKYRLYIFGGTCTKKYLYLIYTGNRILQIEKKTGIATDIIELGKTRNRFMEYFYISCQNDRIFVSPYLGDQLAVYENGDVSYYDLGFGEDIQILAAAFAQNELIMLSQKTESFLSFNIKDYRVNEIKTEHGFCEFPSVDKMDNIFWIIDRKGQVIENNQGEIRVLYQGDQKLKKYHRDHTGEYFVYLNGEVWKRSGNETNKLAMIPDVPHANIGCFSMDGVLYIVYLDRNLIYVLSEKKVNRLTEHDCRYWTDEEGTVVIPTIVPDKYHGGLYLCTNYQHKIIYLGLDGEIIEQPIYIRKQKLDMFMREIGSDDLQSYWEVAGYSKDIGAGTLAEWLTKI